MTMNEKQPLIQHGALHGLASRPVRRNGWLRFCAIVALELLLLLKMGCTVSSIGRYIITRHHDSDTTLAAGEQCRQAGPLFPREKSPGLERLDEFLASAQFLNASISRMAGAIQIPTVTYDDMGEVGDDDRFDAFFDLAAYLERTFPLVHRTLELERINTHGLLFTWEGSDSSLKSTLLMAHQDTVPVEESTIDQWTYPPFSGEFDGRFIWGRGASDCKNILIGLLEAVEVLIDAGFNPKRTVMLSFGFDEEVLGHRGAEYLSRAILHRYGNDSVELIIDEGNNLVKQWGALFAAPAVSEKGYVDIDVIVRMPGGHSSIPPKHNSIGIMGELITHIEANSYEPHLHEKNPFIGYLSCGARYAPEFPPGLKKELHHRNTGGVLIRDGKDRLALEASKLGDAVKYLFTTSQSADLISGGTKVNALPERTALTVNHRINVGNHSSDVRKRLIEVIRPVAEKFDLDLHAFPEDNTDCETPHSITLKMAPQASLEPAPVSPTTILEDQVTAWQVLAGTTRALYGEEVIMAPGISTANTDTRYYWDLTQNIYRFEPAYDAEDPPKDGLGGIHTVNERLSMPAHVNLVKWYILFIRNIDEAQI